MRRLKRVKMSGFYTPVVCFYIKGFMHGKDGMVSLEGENGKTIKTAYLLKQRYTFIEYSSKLLLKRDEILKPLNQKLYELNSQRVIDEKRLNDVEEKLVAFEKPSNGSEWRAKAELQKVREELAIKLTSDNTTIEELSGRINLITECTEHCLHQKLAKMQSQAYTYILGVQRSTRSEGYYLEGSDYSKEVYQDLLPAKENLL